MMIFYKLPCGHVVHLLELLFRHVHQKDESKPAFVYCPECGKMVLFDKKGELITEFPK